MTGAEVLGSVSSASRAPDSVASCTDEKFSYTQKIKKLRNDDLAAIISDGSQLQFRASKDPSCSLHILHEDLGPFDMAFAFRANFSRDYPDVNLIANINAKLLLWQEEGELKVCSTFSTLRLSPLVSNSA
jgi:hypothetical protein